MAEFTDVPDIVMSAFKKKLYRNVSIELDAGVQHKEDFFSDFFYFFQIFFIFILFLYPERVKRVFLQKSENVTL